MSAEFVARTGSMVPTGTQSLALLARRRLVFLALVAATVVLLAAWLVSILMIWGFGFLATLLLACFLLDVPPRVIRFWNSLIGFGLIHLARDPLECVMPITPSAAEDGPIIGRHVVAMTICNEDPARPFLHLATVMASLEKTGHGGQFDYFILSDSTQPAIVEAEQSAFTTADVVGKSRLFYRHRTVHIGHKGGNVHDFCEQSGKNYEIMILLDADSLMSGAAILRLVRIMQAHHRIGILQSFAVGMPSRSFFARVYQFGHRHALRCCNVGAGWWQGDCCQFWGHDAAIRLAPYTEHCRSPVLPGGPSFGGHVMCHDQVEIALMRRAGYEIRFLPEEIGSYEGNPPALPDFLRRHDRWCQGNLQNLRLLRLAGLPAIGRFHLASGAAEFVSAAAVVAFATLAALACAFSPAGTAFPVASALALYVAWMVIYLAPRLLGIADAVMRSRAHYGGIGRLLVGGIVDIVFILLLAPLCMFAAARMIVCLIGGRPLGWETQRRDRYSVTFADALAALGQPTALGLALLAFLAATAPAAIPWFLPFLLGLLLAIPLAVATSSRALGGWALRSKLCATIEDLDPPAEVAIMLPLLLRKE